MASFRLHSARLAQTERTKTSNGPKDNERIRAQASCSVTPALKVGSATRNSCRTLNIISFFLLAFSVQDYLMLSFIIWMMNNMVAKFGSYLGNAASILGNRVRIKKSGTKGLTTELKLEF